MVDTVVFRSTAGEEMTYAVSSSNGVQTGTRLCLFPCPDDPDDFRFVQYSFTEEFVSLKAMNYSAATVFRPVRSFNISVSPIVVEENGGYASTGDYFSVFPQNQFERDTTLVSIPLGGSLPPVLPPSYTTDTINGIPVLVYIPKGISFLVGETESNEYFTYRESLEIGDRTFDEVYASFIDDGNDVPLYFNATFGILGFRDEDGVDWLWEQSY